LRGMVFLRRTLRGHIIASPCGVHARMVHVRHVWVGVFQPLVAVSMGVRFARRIIGTMVVLVIRVM
jgi:hypothetical protein